jgi:hypothetical protein
MREVVILAAAFFLIGGFNRPFRCAVMADSFVFHIDWTTVAIIGVLASLIAVFLYARRNTGSSPCRFPAALQQGWS